MVSISLANFMKNQFLKIFSWKEREKTYMALPEGTICIKCDIVLNKISALSSKLKLPYDIPH